MAKRIDITGQKFGKLLAIKYAYSDNEGKAVWECKCDCGKTHFASGKSLRSGNTKSCGCAKIERAANLKYKDGRCGERLHGVWGSMLKRCYSEKCNVYKHYGARGIKVCEEWKDYSNFKKWAYENGYDDKAPRWECTIDRIDFNKDYCPENCRWVSMDVQRKNKRHGENPYRDTETGRYASKPACMEG